MWRTLRRRPVLARHEARSCWRGLWTAPRAGRLGSLAQAIATISRAAAVRPRERNRSARTSLQNAANDDDQRDAATSSAISRKLRVMRRRRGGRHRPLRHGLDRCYASTRITTRRFWRGFPWSCWTRRGFSPPQLMTFICSESGVVRRDSFTASARPCRPLITLPPTFRVTFDFFAGAVRMAFSLVSIPSSWPSLRQVIGLAESLNCPSSSLMTTV